MSSVDDRVVAMRFDNSAFERGVKTTLSTLDTLKSKLNFSTTSKALTGLDLSPGRFSLPTLGSAVDGVSNKFLAFATVGITALSNVTNKAVDAGLQFAKSFVVSPILDGLHEYETNLQSIQTIQANTDRPLTEINASLKELNEYSDQTIYNFSEMAKNIGTFTAAGVDLKTATSSIKGIANLAALSGSSSAQAATAMYQLSQAISSGKVGLQDWNSVVNAGMGGKKLQTALATTAAAMGKLDIEAIRGTASGKQLTIMGESFRQSISTKPGTSPWLTSDILVNTLATLDGRFSKAALSAQLTSDGLKKYTDAQVKAQIATARTNLENKNGVKYTDEQFKQLMGLSDASYLAATQVKTLGQAFDVAKETVASGWSATFQNVLGDFGESKKVFTKFSGYLNGLINANSIARNKVLSDWNIMGGRQTVIKAITNAWKALTSVLGPIHDAFRDIFPQTTADQLFKITNNIRLFFKEAALGRKNMENLQRTFRGVFAVLHIVGVVIFNVIRYFATFIGLLAGGGGGVLAFTGSIGDLLVAIDAFLTKGDFIGKFFDAVIAARAALLGPIIAVIGQVLRAFGFLITEGPVAFIEQLGKLPALAANVFSAVVNAVSNAVKGIGSVFGKILGLLGIPQAGIDKLGQRINSVFSDAKQTVVDFFNSFGALGSAIAGVFDNFNADAVGNAFGAIKDKLQPVVDFLSVAIPAAFNFVVGVITPIVGFIGNLIGNMFDAAPAAISGLLGVFASLGAAIGGLFGGGGDSSGGDGLSATIQSVSDSLDPALTTMEKIKTAFQQLGAFLGPYVAQLGDVFKNLGTALIGGLVIIAKGIAAVFVGIFKGLEFGASSAAKIPGGIFSSMASGLGNIVGGLIDFVKNLDFQEVLALINTGFFILFYNAARKFFTGLSSIVKAGSGALDEIGGTFNQVTGNLKTMQADVRSNMILKIAIAIGLLAVSLFILSKIPRNDLIKGLTVVALLLTALSVTLQRIEEGTTVKGAVKMQVVAVALGVLGASLLIMAAAIAIFGNMEIGTITKGLGTIAIVLAVVTAMGTAMSKFGGAGSIIVTSIAIGILAVSLVAFAGAIELYAALDPGKMLKGGLLIAAAITVIAYTMGKMPKNMISAAASLFIISVALTILAKALIMFASMSVGDIAKSFIVLSGALYILFVAMMAMNALKPAAVALLIVSGALILLATAMKILGSMSLTEIILALVAMAGAFVVLGLAALILTPLMPVITALAGAIALLGLGVILAGVGLLVLSAGLAALAVSGAAGFAVLIAGIIGFLQILPLIAQQFGLALIAVAVVVGQSAGPIMKAVGQLVIAFLRMLVSILPDVGKFINQLIRTILDVIIKAVPDIAMAGYDLMIGLLNALAKRLPDVITAAADVIVAFLNGLGKNVGRVVDAGVKLIIKFLEGIADAIRVNSDDFFRAGIDIADAIVDGCVQGIRDAAGALIDSIGNMAKDALGKAGDILDIGGPSKAFMDIGENGIGGGLVLGINKSRPKVGAASAAMAKEAVDTVAKTMSNLSLLADAGVNTDPVIRPVLDLSLMANEASKINGLMSTPSIFAEGSVNLAGNVSAEQQASADAAAEAASAASNQPARDVKFEQTINSPTALTATEIYRDTRNLISLAKEALNE